MASLPDVQNGLCDADVSADRFGALTDHRLKGILDSEAAPGQKRHVEASSLPLQPGRILSIIDGEILPTSQCDIPRASLRAGPVEGGDVEYFLSTGTRYAISGRTDSNLWTWLDEPSEGSRANSAIHGVWCDAATLDNVLDLDVPDSPYSDHVPYVLYVLEQLADFKDGDPVTILYASPAATFPARASLGFPYQVGEGPPRQPCAGMEEVASFLLGLGLRPSTVLFRFGVPLDKDATSQWSPRQTVPTFDIPDGVVQLGFTARREVHGSDHDFFTTDADQSEGADATLLTSDTDGDRPKLRLDAVLREKYTSRQIGHAFKIAWLWRCFVSGRVPVHLRVHLKLGPHPTAAKVAQYRLVLRDYVHGQPKGPGVQRVFARPVACIPRVPVPGR